MTQDNTAPAELIHNREYSDERFIDMMAAHHAMAVDMAKIALDKAEHQDLRDMAKDMISTQEKEIKKLRSIKEKSFGSDEVPEKAHPAERSMYAMASTEELSKQDPFDKAFLDSNIPHHSSAIVMASVALRNAEIEDIRTLSRSIVTAQSEEIGKMISWRKNWYPKDA